MYKHTISFRLAFSGVAYALRTQPNFLVHAGFAFASIILGILLQISRIEWLVLTFTIILVFACEMINTAIESMTDLITSEHRQSAKIAKDVSAGMVLIAAIGAVIIGSVIFLPKIL